MYYQEKNVTFKMETKISLLYFTIALLALNSEGYDVSDILFEKRHFEDDICRDYLEIFAINSGNFTQCVIQNARPIEICETCVIPFIVLKDSYEVLLTEPNGTKECKHRYINLDRLGAVESMFKYSYDIWSRAQCDNCFVIINGTITSIPSNETLKFKQLFNDTKECIDNKINNNKTDIVCQDCMELYLKLNDYYETLKKNNKDDICMDIVDSMNMTRRVWSGTLNCCKLRHHPEILYLVSTTVVFCLPALFYFMVKIYADKIKPAILRQNRFAESFNPINRND